MLVYFGEFKEPKTLRILAQARLGWKANMAGDSPPMTDLRDAALAVRENAYAPYSEFKVGAALRGASGTIYTGCNVENVAYPEGTCAEAGAIAAMVAAGETLFTAAYVVAGSPLPVTPCGGCRQKLAEFGAGEVIVQMATVDGVERALTIGELLPGAFDPSFLGG
jgi:cytidine deaminase